jgi:hypothetical protein
VIPPFARPPVEKRTVIVEHTYEIVFERKQVPQSIVCEMSRSCRDVLYNIDFLSVSKQEALMRISVAGDSKQVNDAEAFLRKTGADVSLLSAKPYEAPIPNVPPRSKVMPTRPEDEIRTRLWLTVVGSLRRQPLFWVLSRRYDVQFKILQSTTGDPVSIISMMLWGASAEVEGAINFLREQGVDVEFGVVGELAQPAGTA